MHKSRLLTLFALFALLALSGCAGVRLVDTEVRSFTSAPPIPRGASYRFERLPSQQADAFAQERLENLALQALRQVGLQRQDSTAHYSVQVSYGLKVDPHAPGEQSRDAWGLGWSLGWGVRSGNVAVAANVPFGQLPGFGIPQPSYYWRQVSLIIRNLSTQQVVFETHAAHDGPWSDSEAILPALFEAALRGFPTPPVGVRRIPIEIPR